jgi:hypothetical protein
MRTFDVEVRQTVRVALDETKFTPDFMQEFRDSFYSFDELEEHACHIAQLVARGVVNELTRFHDEFIEGYGPAKDMGIRASVTTFDTETLSQEATDVGK